MSGESGRSAVAVGSGGEPVKMWLVGCWAREPELVEVVKRTKKSAVLRRKREHFCGGGVVDVRLMSPLLFGSFGEAKQYVVGRAEEAVAHLRDRLVRAEEELVRLSGLCEPVGAESTADC